MQRNLVTLAVLTVTVTASTSVTSAQGLRGGGPLVTGEERGSCVSPIDTERARTALEEYRRAFPGGAAAVLGAGDTLALGTNPVLRAYPQAGRWFGDLFTSNFVDLNPTSPGTGDWRCSAQAWTYNGHNASDTIIRTFEEQLLGVPIVAALPGVVAAVHDGEDDMNTSWQGQPANFVILDHVGADTRYWHFKKDSIVVSVGDVVQAGQFLGLTGSSGNSSWPHLHFSVHQNGVVEPFEGPCNPIDSWWEYQRPVPQNAYLYDFGFAPDPLTGTQTPIYGLPRTGEHVMTDPNVTFWVFVPALPASSDWRVVFRRPDGSVAMDSGTNGLGNPFHRWSWWWWDYDVAQSVPDVATTPGTWTVEVSINGRELIAAPLDVVPAATGANRPPLPIDVGFFPPNPMPGDVLHGQVQTHLALDDPDYDTLTYRYEWSVNGFPVRDVTTAAYSDVLPDGSFALGDVVECRVTPSDGSVDGPQAMTSRQIGCGTPVAVRVPARSNLLSAGHAVPDAPGGGSLGYPAVEVPLAGLPGEIVRFPSVTGLVGPGGSPVHGADGAVLASGTDVTSWRGVSGLVHSSRTLFLAGVFLGPEEPQNPAPPRLTADDHESAMEVAPSLGQTFFVGDGRTGTGTGAIQRFRAPFGATRLLLGFVEAPGFSGAHGDYDDNEGALGVEVTHAPLAGCGCDVESYCTTSPNSAGAGAIIGNTGSTSLVANDLELQANGLPALQFGLFFYGPEAAAVPFGNGVQCVGAGTTGVLRLDLTTSDVFGFASHALDVTDPPTVAGQILEGATWNFQYWYRDPAGGGAAFNLSDALAVTFCM